MTQSILYLSRDDVVSVCERDRAVELVRQALVLHARGETVLPDEAYLAWEPEPGESARSLNMPGAIGGDMGVVGTKIINSNPRNPANGLRRAAGVTILFDRTTAAIRCIMDASYISALRTAAVTALSAAALHRRGPVSAVLVGAGELAAAHLSLLPEALPDLARVGVYDVVPERAARLAERYAAPLSARGVSLAPVDDVAVAVAKASLVVPVTTVTTGYIEPEWLQPGALVVNVSLDDVTAEVMMSADKLFVDDWGLVEADSRRLLGRMARAGRVCGPRDTAVGAGARRVDAELGDVLSGRHPGRESPDEVVVVNPFGLAIEDIAIAGEVFDVANRRDVGIRVPR